MTKAEILTFKIHIIIGMLNGTFNWDKGCILRRALDILEKEGGDLSTILKNRFGIDLQGENDEQSLQHSDNKPHWG